ncbi:hypothetical protein [Cyanobacterium aponinum]|uniref:hypothetical protein n=1 Tax=Cyanobacterium aponinum TaxID=379064 RepID=UPI000C12D335|nr:hypothetical protein [Cyanobacterium aponinum]PHV61069.1 hypothetical protein CSQ80_17570 [Cyanobacterium aponinum IPPAS B-1201]
MTTIIKKMNEIKLMTKEEADRLREMYKDDNDIDYSDIPEITDEMLPEAQFLQVGEFIPKTPLSIKH